MAPKRDTDHTPGRPPGRPPDSRSRPSPRAFMFNTAAYARIWEDMQRLGRDDPRVQAAIRAFARHGAATDGRDNDFYQGFHITYDEACIGEDSTHRDNRAAYAQATWDDAWDAVSSIAERISHCLTFLNSSLYPIEFNAPSRF